MAYYDFLDSIFGFLLNMNPLLAVIIVAFFISVLIILITKFATDQKLMKSLKEDLKGHQKQMKELKSNPAKTMEAQKKAMEINMKYMMHSMKPTLITFIPIILIFGWMSAHFAFESIQPQQNFSVSVIFDNEAKGSASIKLTPEISALVEEIQDIENGRAKWTLQGEEGTHTLEFDYNNQTYYRDVIITSGSKYAPALEKINSGGVDSIQINYKKSTLIPIGFKDWLGWLGVYIWASIIFTTSLRKLMKVY